MCPGLYITYQFSYLVSFINLSCSTSLFNSISFSSFDPLHTCTPAGLHNSIFFSTNSFTYGLNVDRSPYLAEHLLGRIGVVFIEDIIIYYNNSTKNKTSKTILFFLYLHQTVPTSGTLRTARSKAITIIRKLFNTVYYKIERESPRNLTRPFPRLDVILRITR